MKAFSLTEPYHSVLIDIPEPVPSKTDAILKLVRNGICGSDLNSYRGKNSYLSYPRIPGHEIVGEIVSIPKNTKDLSVGMLVTCNPYFNCGHCYSCSRGFINCCQQNETMGVQRDGAMKDFISMPVERLIAGNGLSPDYLALVEPFSIAYHGIKKAHIAKGDNVLIIGAGTIGMFAALSAKVFGANVFIADIANDKLIFASNHFTIDGTILNDSTTHFNDQVNKYTDGHGFDVVIEAAGTPSTFQACIDAAAFCGKIIQIGISNRTLDFNFTIIQKKELSIYGSRNATSEDFEEVVSLFLKRNDWNLLSMISATFPFLEAPEAFAFLDANTSTLFKVMLKH